MEITNVNFEIIECENNYCKFVWKNIFTTTKGCVCSSTFSIANCSAKLQVIVDFSKYSNMRIGLQKVDFPNISIQTLLVCKVTNTLANTSFKEYVESKFSHKDKTSFGDYIKIKPSLLNYWFYSPEPKGLNIEGCVFIKHCSELNTAYASPDETIQQLQKDFKSVFRDGVRTDVIIHLKNGTIRAHKVVLCTRSAVFKRMFEHDMKEKLSGIVEVTDVDYLTFEKLVEFLYTGAVEKCNFNEVMALYSAADKYEVITLQKTCRDIINTYLNQNTVSLILKTADMHHDVELKNMCRKFT